MVTVGMLHCRKHPEQIKKAYACAAVAKMEGIDFFYFSPGNVNLEQKTIEGYVFEMGNWIQKTMRFPDVIYNSSSMKTMAQKEIYRELKKKIPFTSHPIGNKMKVFRKINKMDQFASYLIPSKKISNSQEVLESLNEFNRVVIKPLAGNRGEKVIFIERNEDHYIILEGNNKKIISENELRLLIETVIVEKKFLVQPYIYCKTKEGFPFDFRIHIQKNGSGVWEIALIYPRIGSNDGIVSNVSKGGYIGKLESFLEREYGLEGYNIQKNLEMFAVRFSEKFDALHKMPLDELGIDIGIDENKKLWIFEVNWRPGYIYRELDAAKKIIPYAAYLVSKNG